MCCACSRLIGICPHPLHLQPQVALVLVLLCDHRLEGPERLGMSQVPLDRSFALHACPVPSPTRATFNPDPGPTDSTDDITDHKSNDSRFTPRTPGALEVVSCGLCRSPARLIAHPFPQSARHTSRGTKLPARLSTLTPDTASPGGHRNAAHPDEDERPPGRSPYTKRRYVSPCHTLLL